MFLLVNPGGLGLQGNISLGQRQSSKERKAAEYSQRLVAVWPAEMASAKWFELWLGEVS